MENSESEKTTNKDDNLKSTTSSTSSQPATAVPVPLDNAEAEVNDAATDLTKGSIVADNSAATAALNSSAAGLDDSFSVSATPSEFNFSFDGEDTEEAVDAEEAIDADEAVDAEDAAQLNDGVAGGPSSPPLWGLSAGLAPGLGKLIKLNQIISRLPHATIQLLHPPPHPTPLAIQAARFLNTGERGSSIYLNLLGNRGDSTVYSQN